jgi:hypothetical protein
LRADGAERHPGAVSALLPALADVAAALPRERAGVRLRGLAAVAPVLAHDGPVWRLAAAVLGRSARPVRALLFDKAPHMNWALGWHQDRTICVQRRVETPGFGPWTVKAGTVHVAPPADLLSRMVTLRLHLDPVAADNGPLLVAPGSHRLGRIAERDIAATVARCGSRACLAEAGDAWLYSTPILHASDAAVRPAHRRVLQIDYAAENLPEGLDWAGI